jgi:hypothetical protein
MEKIVLRLRDQINREDGQATVEFALMLTMLLFLLFMIFMAGVTYMTSQYIKYAAFMGARTYAVSGEDAGRNIIKSYLGERGEKLFPFIRPPIEVSRVAGDEVGFRIKYKSLFYFPILGRGIASEGVGDAITDTKKGFLVLEVKSTMKDENLKCPGNKFDNKDVSGDGC